MKNFTSFLAAAHTAFSGIGHHGHHKNPDTDYKFLDNVAVFDTPTATCDATYSVLESMGIPYTRYVRTLKSDRKESLNLVDKHQHGKHSMIIMCSNQVRLQDTDGDWKSTLSESQWAELESYQIKYGVRQVNFDVWPETRIGVNPPPNNEGCCKNDEEQFVSLTPEASNIAEFSGINPKGKFTTKGQQHNPTTLYTGPKVNGSFYDVTPILEFAPKEPQYPSSSRWIGGVVTTYQDGRQEMNFFLTFGAWSKTSVTLQHLMLQWGLRSSYSGFRRAYLNMQVDDYFLQTDANNEFDHRPYPFRTNIEDTIIHRDWQKAFTRKLAPGSNVVLELVFNANGVMMAADEDSAIYTKEFPEVPNAVGFVKPLGTGENNWPRDARFTWKEKELLRDPLYKAVQTTPGLKESFYWVSHTFTHMELNNATYSDTVAEISFNSYFGSSKSHLGGAGKSWYTHNALVPPAITGMFNGDALRAMKDNGIESVCGDNSRVELKAKNPFHPLQSTRATNGYDGMVIIPRHATEIYFNVSTIGEEVNLYKEVKQVSKSMCTLPFLLMFFFPCVS